MTAERGRTPTPETVAPIDHDPDCRYWNNWPRDLDSDNCARCRVLTAPARVLSPDENDRGADFRA